MCRKAEPFLGKGPRHRFLLQCSVVLDRIVVALDLKQSIGAAFLAS